MKTIDSSSAASTSSSGQLTSEEMMVCASSRSREAPYPLTAGSCPMVGQLAKLSELPELALSKRPRLSDDDDIAAPIKHVNLISPADPTAPSFFDPLPEELITGNIFIRLPLQALGRAAMTSKKSQGWANETMRLTHQYGPPRFNNLVEVGQFFVEINRMLQAGDNDSDLGRCRYELTQLHQMVVAGTAPKIHLPTLLPLFQKKPSTRTLDDLKIAGLLTCEQIEGVRLDEPQIRYLTSNKVLLALVRGVRPNLKALSSIPAQYLSECFPIYDRGLLKAIGERQWDIVAKMVESQLFIKISDDGTTPLHDAVLTHANAVVQTMLAAGATEIINWRNGPDDSPMSGSTALHYAAFIGQSSTVMTNLIAHGAALDLYNDAGNLPLHYLILRAEDGMIRDFLAAGGIRVINLKNRNGETPLDFMLEYSKNDEVEHILRAAGAKTAAELADE